MAAWPDEAPLFHLQLYGAGHVGRAMVQTAGTPCPVTVDWIDEREAEFPDRAQPAAHPAAVCGAGRGPR